MKYVDAKGREWKPIVQYFPDTSGLWVPLHEWMPSWMWTFREMVENTFRFFNPNAIGRSWVEL